jgi:ketosteroid isomerase-like protein
VAHANVDAYTSAVEAWNRGDIDGLLAYMDEEVEIHSFLVAMEGRFHGHDGVRRWWQSFQELLPDWRADVERIEPRGSATVARLRVTGHGRESGVPVDQTIWHVIEWRDGKVVRFSAHRTEAEALEAVNAQG